MSTMLTTTVNNITIRTTQSVEEEENVVLCNLQKVVFYNTLGK